MTATEPSRSFPTALLDPREMAEADRLTALRMPSVALMERAGAAVATTALRLLAGRRRVVVLCGPGNNGGDGYVTARLLREAGAEVVVASLVARDDLEGDAAWAARLWTGAIEDLNAVDVENVDLVIDALFGAGLSRDVDGVSKIAIERVAATARHDRPVLAIDMPSGVDGASGALRGVTIEATDTITFFRLKPGHVLMPGRLRCGRLELADIGIAPDVLISIAPKTSLNERALWFDALPLPSLAGHKYARGHAVVVSGPLAQTGAARLSARGALRAGAGLVTVATPREALLVHAMALTAIMTEVADDADALRSLLDDKRRNTVVLGPGLGVGEATRDKVRIALAPSHDAHRAVVLDADALASFADRPRDLFDAIGSGGQSVVMTPHDGEFAKLFGSVLDIRAAKPARTRAAAAASGAVVVLKGPDTVVADPDGRASIAASEAPWLATAGSGDVLAGMIGGLLAQGMAPWLAASAAVWLHAEAARRFGPGLISEDLPDLLPGVLRTVLDNRPTCWLD